MSLSLPANAAHHRDWGASEVPDDGTPLTSFGPDGIESAWTPISLGGTSGDDVYTGDNDKNHYNGGDGNDIIYGEGGHDKHYGDNGDDRINGGDGDDIVYGGTGDDLTRGGKGSDRMFNQSGGVARGNQGNDVITGVNATLHGGAGNDYLSGFDYKGHGGLGDDNLDIQNAFYHGTHERLSGGAGADTFEFDLADHGDAGGTVKVMDLTNEDFISFGDTDADIHKPGGQGFKIVPKFDSHAGDITIDYDAASDRTYIVIYTSPKHTPTGTIVLPGNHADFPHDHFLDRFGVTGGAPIRVADAGVHTNAFHHALMSPHEHLAIA